MNRLRSTVFALATLGTLAACAPAMAPGGVEVVVRRPPAARHEIRGRAPGPGYVWVEGHFAWRASDYVWIAGRWERPPEPRFRRWQPGHWQHVRGGWVWVDGKWA